MTDDEWDSIAYLLEESYSGEFDENKRDAYRFHLDRFPPQQIMAALHLLGEEGDQWLPSAPRIVKACREVAAPSEGVPSFTEAWAMLMAPIRRGLDEDAGIAWLNQTSVLVAQFAVAYGYDRLRTQPFEHEGYGGKLVAEVEQRWDEFVEVARRRLAAGRALEAATPRDELEAPKRMDEVALLKSAGLTPQKELTGGDS